MDIRRSGRKRRSYLSEDDSEYEEEPTSEIVTRNRSLASKRQKRGVEPQQYMDPWSQSRKLLTNVMKHQYAWPFNTPVDPVDLGIPDYFEKITHPMDFSTVQKKFEAGQYATIDEFAADVRLVFTNCLTYNLPGSEICFMANTLSTYFEKHYKNVKASESEEYAIPDPKNAEIEELQVIIRDLKKEHAKLLNELQKLVKEHNTPPSPISPRNGTAGKKKRGGRKKLSPTTKLNIKNEPFTFEKKAELKENIGQLSLENLQKMVDLISSELPDTQKKNGELEIELDNLSDDVLRKLDSFVSLAIKQQKEREEHRTIEENVQIRIDSNSPREANANGANGNSSNESSSSESETESEPEEKKQQRNNELASSLSMDAAHVADVDNVAKAPEVLTTTNQSVKEDTEVKTIA